MNIVMVSSVTMNPYVRLLGAALEQADAGVTCAYETALTADVAARWRGKADVIHIHWPEIMIRGRSTLRTLRKLTRLARSLRTLKGAGSAVVYTAHNVRRSGDGVGLLGALAEDIVYRSADVVHVHDDGARTELADRRPARRCVVIAHGNYIGAYPDVIDGAQARQRLNIDSDAFVYLALGQIRPYKGLADLVSAFCSLPGEHLRLLIAGRPQHPRDGEHLQALAKDDRRVQVHARYVADDDVQVYVRAADMCVFPYRSGTTSGAAILALSFGRPIIAPDVWPFRGLLRDGGGILYTGAGDGLRRALAAAASTANVGELAQQALTIARGLDWRALAQQHLDVYRSVARMGSGRHD